MLLENTSHALREFGEKLFSLVEEVTGLRPQPIRSGNWYRAEMGGGRLLYLRFIGERARSYPVNSVHLSARWDEQLAGPGVRVGNNWYGNRPSADLAAVADNPEEVALAKSFIRRVAQLHGR